MTKPRRRDMTKRRSRQKAAGKGQPNAERAGEQPLGDAARVATSTGTTSAGNGFTPGDAALVLLLMLWLHAFETMLDESGYAVVVAWLATSVALVALWLSVRRRRQGRAPRWAKITASLVACIAAFSGAAHAIASGHLAEWSRDDMPPSPSSEQHEAGRTNEPPAGIKQLLCRSDLVVFGRPRSSVERYVGLVDDMIYSVPWETLLDRIPADFAQYAMLVDPTIGKLPDAERPAAIGRAFLQWQFPRYALLIGLPDADALGSRVWGCDHATDLMSPGILVEDNRLGAAGIYGVTPLFKAVIAGEWASRLRSYWLIVKYSFSPHDRRDLQQDPYFLLYRGELTEFEKQVNNLPQARREFLLKKRAAL